MIRPKLEIMKIISVVPDTIAAASADPVRLRCHSARLKVARRSIEESNLDWYTTQRGCFRRRTLERTRKVVTTKRVSILTAAEKA